MRLLELYGRFKSRARAKAEAKYIKTHPLKSKIMRFKLANNKVLLFKTLESEIYSMFNQCAIVLLISVSFRSQDLSIWIKS